MLLNLTLFVSLLLANAFNQVASGPIAINGPYTNSAAFSHKVENIRSPTTNSRLVTLNLESFQTSKVILSGNTTISSKGNTFRVGFFTPGDESAWYLGIYYASIPVPTYVWVANRERPVKNMSSAALVITEDGQLAVIDQDSRTLMWQTNNVEKASDLRLLEQGNLVLLSPNGAVVWQSFDFPTDTWLPGMNLTAGQMLTSWKSSIDPSPGRFSLRLNPPKYGEIALFYNNNVGGESADTDNSTSNSLYDTYWTSGDWNGNAFSDIPEMTVPYIYKFDFLHPFTPMATFGYTEVPLESGTNPPLTRFVLHHMGQLRQFTWSQQIENWNMFWSQPDNTCRVYALCGNLGFCNGKPFSPCQCLNGFNPVESASWDKGDFSKGCTREGDLSSCKNDLFEDVGVMSYEKTTTVSFSGSRSECESSCLKNCSCLGLLRNDKDNMCKNVYGSLLNMRNLTSDSTIQDRLYLRVQSTESFSKNKKKNSTLLIGIVIGILVITALIIGTTVNLLYLRRRKVRKRRQEEAGIFQLSSLRFFTYKELHAITRGFSEKLGHGGFGAVFLGKLPDSSMVAVKRLERPGGGEQEFRAEVRTIGNIQHVNLVRLRGFCSEKSHRLLAYDYMPNGPLSAYLKRGGPNLSWDVRFRVAIGTARGIAYLHEECRNRIIHCDIKPENILLDDDFSPKVSDFGLAKLIGRDFSRILATMRGTWGYVAPEWISGVAITTKADVYSYGMTMLELIGGRRNVEANDRGGKEEGDESEKWFFPPYASQKIIEGKIEDVIDERLGGSYSREEAERVGMVSIWCIQDDETVRPSMGTVVKMLEGVVEVAVPPPPKLLQALVSGESFRGVVVESGNREVEENDGDGDDGGGGDADVSISIDKTLEHYHSF